MKTPFLYEPGSPEIYAHAGRVVVAWGRTEETLHNFTIGLMESNGTTPPKGWQFWKFPQRRELFERELAAAFADHPGLIAYFAKAIEDADAARLQRNLLVHGRLVYGLGTKEALIATGREGEKEFTVDVLRQLFLDIGHVNGRLHIGNTENLPITPAEREVLRQFKDRRLGKR